MKRYWELVRTRIDDMSLRERVMIFMAAAFVVITVINALLLDPLLAKQRLKYNQVVQQQENMKALQAQTEALLRAKQENQQSPLRQRINALQKQLSEQEAYLQSRRDRLVAPEKMAELLEKMLGKHGRLQMVRMETLPVGLLVEKPPVAPGGAPAAASAEEGRQQVFKHGLRISLRGSYAELASYIAALERMPTQMFWGEANLTVEQYPDAVLTLTLYTLSLEKIWLQV